MNWDRIVGSCKQVVGKAQQRWGEWLEDELVVLAGRQTQLAGRIQERCGRACEAAEHEIESWQNGHAKNVVWLHGDPRRRRAPALAVSRVSASEAAHCARCQRILGS